MGSRVWGLRFKRLAPPPYTPTPPPAREARERQEVTGPWEARERHQVTGPWRRERVNRLRALGGERERQEAASPSTERDQVTSPWSSLGDNRLRETTGNELLDLDASSWRPPSRSMRVQGLGLEARMEGSELGIWLLVCQVLRFGV